MKPPICEICLRRFNHAEEGGTISFKKTKSNLKWEKRVKKKGIVEHPPYMEWFCGEHFDAAKKLEHLHRHEALEELKNLFLREEESLS